MGILWGVEEVVVEPQGEAKRIRYKGNLYISFHVSFMKSWKKFLNQPVLL